MRRNIDDREERREIVRYRMDKVVFVWFVVWDLGFGYFRVSSSYNLHLNLIISRLKLETLTMANVKAILQLLETFLLKALCLMVFPSHSNICIMIYFGL